MPSYNKIDYPKTSFMQVFSQTTAGALGTTVFMDEAVISVGPNFAEDAGAANALVATVTSPISGVLIYPLVGTTVILKTANALQAGANTFNFNGHGTDAITSQQSGSNARNLKTIITAGAVLELIFDGTQWQAVGY